MATQNQRGFSAIEVVIAVVIVAAIAVTGYLLYDRMSNNNGAAPSASEQTEKATTPDAPNINSADDLDEAEKALDETNLDASEADAAALDAELDNF